MIAGTSTELDATLAFHEGDTWTGIPLFTVTGTVFTSDISLVEMVFLTDDEARREACRITSADPDQIDINTPTSPTITWGFVIPTQTLPLTRGKYVWAIHITDDADPPNRQHYAEGNILVKPKRRRVPILPA
jgi:hypothetical protein